MGNGGSKAAETPVAVSGHVHGPRCNHAEAAPGELHAAAKAGDAAAAEAALAKGASTEEADGEGKGTALYWAATGGHLAVVRALIAAGADVNARGGAAGMTALQEAVLGGHAEVIEALLDDPRILPGEKTAGQTALALAWAKNRPAAAAVFMARGISA